MKAPEYRSYVLRFWREDAEDDPSWRFVLLNPNSREQRGFAGLEQLVAFMNEQMQQLARARSADREGK